MSNKFKISFFVLLLLSSTVFPSFQLSYATLEEGTIFTGETEIVSSLETVTGGLNIEPGGTLIIEESGDLTINGLLFNLGLVVVDGLYLQNGDILLGGDIEWRCGTFNHNGNVGGPGSITTPDCLDGTNEIDEVNLVVKENETFIVKQNQILTLSGETTIFGILENKGVIDNFSKVTLEEFSLLKNTGTFTSHCVNFGFTGVNGNGEVQDFGDVDTNDCTAPDAVDDDFYITNEDTTLNVDGILINDVLENDSEGDSPLSELTASAETKSAEDGIVVMNPDGTFQYTPKNNFFGEDRFQYRVIDGTGGSDTATVTIQVTGVDDPPVAVDDPEIGSIAVDEDSSITIPVLNNDSDPDNDSLSITSTTQGTIGATAIDGTDVTYTPNPNIAGSDSFTYTISDGNGGTDTATVNINVIEQNDQPEITLNGLALISLEVGDTYTEQGAICSDNEDVDKAATIGGDMVNTSYPGVSVVTYDCQDSDGSSAEQVTRTVTVETNDLPEIEILGANPASVIVGETYLDAGAEATDTEDGNLTNSIAENDNVDTSLVGEYQVNYSVTDSDGNTDVEIRTVNVVTNQPPVIEILGANPASVIVGETYLDAGAEATDTEDGNLTNSIAENDNVDTSLVGEYQVNYSVTDSDGNTDVEIRTVNVNEILDDNLRDQTIEQIMNLENLIDEATDKKTKDEINKALKELNKSIETKKWEDNGNYLIDNEGKKVFDEQQKGVDHITHILDKNKESDEFLAKVTSIALDLIDIDEELSGNEFTIAEESPDSEQSCLDDAEKELEKSDKEEGKGKYDKAIDHLGHHWEKSLKCQGIDDGGHQHGPK